MRGYIVILLFFVSFTSYAQFFGYQGKRLEITTGLTIMPNPTIINPMRYGIDKDVPSGLALPYSPSVEFNFALSRHIGIGFSVWYAKNFIGYRVPGVNGGYYTGNEIPEDLVQVLAPSYFNFDKNHYLHTYYTGVTFRYYTRSFIAPAGNYFEIGYGKVKVINDENNIYEYNTNKFYYSKDGNAIPQTSSEITTKIIDHPKIDPVGLLSFGYFVRKETKFMKNLLYDVGATFSFGIGGQPESVQDVLVISNQYNVQVSSKDDLESLINGTTYVFIRKQNFIRISAKLVYLF